jgi:aminoglycoside/choline kinase family phosphotransferase
MFPIHQKHTPTDACVNWAQDCLGPKLTISAMAEHAHQNKYHFSVICQKTKQRFLLVETHNDISSSLKFTTTTKILRKNGIHTPQVHHQKFSTEACWMIVDHFGDETMLDWLNQRPTERQQNIVIHHCLCEIQKFQKQKIEYPIPTYNTEKIRNDMQRCETDYLQNLLGASLSPREKAHLAHAKTYISEQIEKIPNAPMHFDFHSANIMMLPEKTLGILDFQDIQIGPINYDLASLLTDHYYHHPHLKISHTIQKFYDEFVSKEHQSQISAQLFTEMTQLIAIQRHLKNIGIFSKLYLQGKKHYLNHIPGMMHRLQQLCLQNEILAKLPGIIWSSSLAANLDKKLIENQKQSTNESVIETSVQ